MNYIEKIQSKYPEVTGRQNQFSNHPNQPGVKINVQQSTFNLLTTVEIFESLEVKHCVVFGTLLGLYRDGNLIEYDTDTDIAVWIDNERELIKIVEKAEENKLMLTRVNRNIISFTRGGDYIDIYLYRKQDENSNELSCIGAQTLGTLTTSDFSKNNTVNFNNRKLACPVDPESYFQKLYGSDWRTPIKDKHAHIKHGNR